ncbi:MAG: glycosyltransferase [Terracidiphilus sp.]|jgi:glycosyltransferase involved in cell wall biosynthesis
MFLGKKPSRPRTHRARILLLIPHLGGGGAERVTALLARGLSAEKYELHLGLITQSDARPEELPSSVTIHPLGALRVRTGALRLLRLVRRLEPDLIVSGIFHLNFLVLLLRPFFAQRISVLVRQNGTVSAALAFGNLSVSTRLLYRLLYRHANRVICQTQAMAEDLAAELGIAQQRLAVLNNPIDIDEIRKATAHLWTGPGPHLLAVGRLAREKGFDLLLRALAAVRQQFPNADLVIAGAGPEEAALKTICRELGIAAAVRFVGHVDRPHAYFPGATLFALSSRHEGMPNALLEAAAAGLPLVALPASQGVVDLLCDHPGAWLAPEISAEALAITLLAALQDLHSGQRFAHPFIEEFRIDRALEAYEQLIDEVLQERQP